MDESYVIFITEKDVIGRGQAIYSVNRYFEDTKELFDDGNHIIYVNGAYKNDESVTASMSCCAIWSESYSGFFFGLAILSLLI